ncbi:hypothetical protein CGI68_24825, partial [Vibrio parahaemolyticus]
ALGAVKKFLGLISFYSFGNLLQFLGNLALSFQILELLNPQNMSRFAGCFIRFCRRFVISFFGSNRFNFICLRNGFIGFDFALKVSLSKSQFTC